jgi:hypothetical protein
VYQHHKEVKAALGVKIAAPGLERAIAGSRLLVVSADDDEELLKEEVMSDLADLFANIDKSGRGVWVQASTLGSLEALLTFLKSSKIPVRERPKATERARECAGARDCVCVCMYTRVCVCVQRRERCSDIRGEPPNAGIGIARLRGTDGFGCVGLRRCRASTLAQCTRRT